MQTGIVVYEDNEQLRESLGTMITLSGDLLLLGSYGNVQDVQQQIKDLQPEVILMDIDMPGLNGIEAVKLIRQFDSRVQIIMLTVFDDNTHVYSAICAGASGYLLKKDISDKLLTAISDVMQGEVPMSPGLARMVIQNIQQQAPAVEKDYGLTPREKEILKALSQGNSYKMVAAILNISIDTVRTHIKRIYEKLRVHSQIEAITRINNGKLL